MQIFNILKILLIYWSIGAT